MRFCPRDGTLLVPVRREGRTVLKCNKCGYEEEVVEATTYRQKSIIGEDKKRGVAMEYAIRQEVDREELEEYRKQLLENLRESEGEED